MGDSLGSTQYGRIDEEVKARVGDLGVGLIMRGAEQPLVVGLFTDDTVLFHILMPAPIPNGSSPHDTFAHNYHWACATK